MGWLQNAANTGPGKISDIIGKTLPAVKLTHGITYTVVDPGGTFDPSDPTGNTPTATDYSVQGFVDEDMERYRQAGVVTLGQRVVLLTRKSCDDAGLTLRSGTVEAEGDKVLARGITSVVKEVGTDPASALWVLGVTP